MRELRGSEVKDTRPCSWSSLAELGQEQDSQSRIFTLNHRRLLLQINYCHYIAKGSRTGGQVKLVASKAHPEWWLRVRARG